MTWYLIRIRIRYQVIPEGPPAEGHKRSSPQRNSILTPTMTNTTAKDFLKMETSNL